MKDDFNSLFFSDSVFASDGIYTSDGEFYMTYPEYETMYEKYNNGDLDS